MTEPVETPTVDASAMEPWDGEDRFRDDSRWRDDSRVVVLRMLQQITLLLGQLAVMVGANLDRVRELSEECAELIGASVEEER